LIQLASELGKIKFTAPLATIFDNRLRSDTQQELRRDGVPK